MPQLQLVQGSLLDQDVDAIVNAANTMMRGGGGLDGAIHMAAGPALLRELQRVAPKGCPTGEVVVTPGYESGFTYILHTPGPIWRGGTSGEPELLAASYRNSVLKADEIGIQSLGFASISTGVYGYPLDQAAPLAVRTVQDAASGTGLRRIVFAMRGASEYEAFARALAPEETA